MLVFCKKKIYQFLALCGTIIVLLGAGITPARAAGERAYFGSESYEWEAGVETMIGIYVSADQTLNNVDYIISYDAQALRHTLGGEDIEVGKIRIHGENLGGTEYKRLINFVPLRGGDTEITVDEVRVSDPAGNAETAESAAAAIHVPVAESCRLDGITVNGEPVSGFDGDRTDYTVSVEADVEQAEIETSPLDRTVEISDTRLETGTNDIQIMVSGDGDDRALYTLHLIRREPEPLSDTAPTEDVNSRPMEEAGLDQNTGMGESFRLSNYERSVYGFLAWCRNCVRELLTKYTLLAVLMGALIIAFTVLLVMKARIRKIKKSKGKKSFTWPDEEMGGKGAGEEADSRKTEIRIKNVTMDFKRERDESGSIKELAIRVLKRQRNMEHFRALDNISFDVRKGEVVGVIGTNGSGKSTILKIISGALIPTKGKVEVDKDKIQLLTLGTGFDRELTGRENVYLNGALIGYSQKYIDEKYDDIVKFAELEGFMEERVKNYSSGMVSRLGFAIATACSTSEILILDEVLSVGDIFFRRKSEKRIQEMIHGGSTVLIVSHSTAVIRNNCTKVVWIERGRLRAVGDPDEVCDAYERMNK